MSTKWEMPIADRGVEICSRLFRNLKLDVLVKGRLTGENRCPAFLNYLELLDSGLRRNDDS